MVPRRSIDNPRTLLFPCKKRWTHVTSRKEGSPEGDAGTGKAARAEKTVSKRSFDTGPCPVEIPRTSQMRNRRITEISFVVRGYRKLRRF